MRWVIPFKILFFLFTSGLGLILAGCASSPKAGNLFPWLDKNPQPEVAQAPAAQSAAGSTAPAPTVYRSSAVEGEKSENELGAGSKDWSLPEIPNADENPFSPGSETSPNAMPDVNMAEAGRPEDWRSFQSLTTRHARLGMSSDPDTPLSTLAVQPPSEFHSPPILGSPLPGSGVHRGGSSAPAFSATSFDGRRITLAELTGRVVVLDFWRKSCGPCLKAMPQVEALREQHPESRLAVFGVNTDEKKATLQAFLKTKPTDIPQIHAWSQKPNPIHTFGVSLLPHFVVIDQVGKVQYRGGSATAMIAKVEELIAAPSLPAPVSMGAPMALAP